jgi:separase
MLIRSHRPACVANLWDVTDKDIDRCTTATMTSWGLWPRSSPDAPLPNAGRTDLAQALALGRETCTLRYLNGAAAIMYGLPVGLQSA